MDILTRADIRELARVPRNGPCVSLYLPTTPVAVENGQDLIRYKNLVKSVEEGLSAGGMRGADLTALLLPFKALQEDAGFWRHSTSGLAVLGCADEFITYRVTGPVGPAVAVADRYMLKPLIPLIDHGDHFLVLALSLNSVRLMKGGRYEMAEVALEDVPASLADALKWDDYEREVQFFSTAMGTTASQTFYGTGSEGKDHKAEIARYFQRIDAGVRELVGGSPTPLVLAGVDYLLPIYRSISHYPALVDGGVSGNPEKTSPAQMHEKAWAVAEPLFARARAQALERLGDLKSAGRTSSDLSEIAPAAMAGRVETLFLDVNVEAWGNVGPDGEGEIHIQPVPGDFELYDFTATQTLLADGDVWAVDRETEPELGYISAIYRY
jgi:hypothetical protein